MQVQNRKAKTIRLLETFTKSKRHSIEALPKEKNLVSMWKYELEFRKKPFFNNSLTNFDYLVSDARDKTKDISI